MVKKGKKLPRCDEDSIHGIVYIAAENYMHALIDALSEIENEFQNFQKNYKYFCLHGDLIAGIQKNPMLLILKENEVTMRM